MKEVMSTKIIFKIFANFINTSLKSIWIRGRVTFKQYGSKYTEKQNQIRTFDYL